MTFEQGFAEAERAAGAALKVAGALTAASKQMEKAAAEGDLGKIRKAAERMAALADSMRQEAINAGAAWPFSAAEEDTYLRESYAAELVEAASVANLQIQRRDEGPIVNAERAVALASAEIEHSKLLRKS